MKERKQVKHFDHIKRHKILKKTHTGEKPGQQEVGSDTNGKIHSEVSEQQIVRVYNQDEKVLQIYCSQYASWRR